MLSTPSLNGSHFTGDVMRPVRWIHHRLKIMAAALGWVLLFCTMVLLHSSALTRNNLPLTDNSISDNFTTFKLLPTLRPTTSWATTRRPSYKTAKNRNNNKLQDNIFLFASNFLPEKLRTKALRRQEDVNSSTMRKIAGIKHRLSSLRKQYDLRGSGSSSGAKVNQKKNNTDPEAKYFKLFPTSNQKTPRERRNESESDVIPTIYVITPTYTRPQQIAELTRLGQTLRHVKALHWLVSEDADAYNLDVSEYLARSGVNYSHLLGPMPPRFKKAKKRDNNDPRGVSNRLAGLEWIRNHAKEGVLYFADDDNAYDVRLFEEIRRTKVVSMFPVGLVAELGLSTPIVRDGMVVGFYDGFISERTYPVDMAGFAVNVQYFLQQKHVTMPFKQGYEEDGFLRSLKFSISDIEPLADNCTKVLVWHTKTVKYPAALKITRTIETKLSNTNLARLVLTLQ